MVAYRHHLAFLATIIGFCCSLALFAQTRPAASTSQPATTATRRATTPPTTGPSRYNFAVRTTASAPAVRVVAEPPERTARMAWFREANFGMFIHWGLYAVAAGEWKGQPIPGLGEWIMNRTKIPVKEYEQLALQFNPTQFDAEAFAQLAQDAGMKYMVITAKHHDGFAMFKSSASSFNIVDATPFKRDPMKELSAACAKRGITFGFYYSQAQDWHEPGGMGNDWDFPANEEKDKSGAFDKYLDEKVAPQLRELLTNYGPIGLIWFDTPQQMTAPRAAKLEKIVHELQPNCLVSGRIGPGSVSDYTSQADNRIPQVVTQGDWETPATLNETWGYKKSDTNWKTANDLTFRLVDIVSKNGNYLLNVGPTGDGVIPQASQNVLREVGTWLKVNGEAIYGAGPTPFGPELGATAATPDARGRTPFVPKTDMRVTSKPHKLYFIFFNWPTDTKFITPNLPADANTVYFLTDPTHKPLVFKAFGKACSITLPAKPPTPSIATTLVVETD